MDLILEKKDAPGDVAGSMGDTGHTCLRPMLANDESSNRNTTAHASAFTTSFSLHLDSYVLYSSLFESIRRLKNRKYKLVNQFGQKVYLL